MTEKLSNERSELTLQRLEAALQRLLDGKPERTADDGKLNINRINDEAGLSSGAIYYYKEFMTKARAVISKRKEASLSTNRSKKTGTHSFRQQRDEEKRLKEKYRAQRDEIKTFCDKVVEQNANLEFALFEASERIKQLELELQHLKVVGIHQGRQS